MQLDDEAKLWICVGGANAAAKKEMLKMVLSDVVVKEMVANRDRFLQEQCRGPHGERYDALNAEQQRALKEKHMVGLTFDGERMFLDNVISKCFDIGSVQRGCR